MVALIRFQKINDSWFIDRLICFSLGNLLKLWLHIETWNWIYSQIHFLTRFVWTFPLTLSLSPPLQRRRRQNCVCSRNWYVALWMINRRKSVLSTNRFDARYNFRKIEELYCRQEAPIAVFNANLMASRPTSTRRTFMLCSCILRLLLFLFPSSSSTCLVSGSLGVIITFGGVRRAGGRSQSISN